jgi:hypothetical protein
MRKGGGFSNVMRAAAIGAGLGTGVAPGIGTAIGGLIGSGVGLLSNITGSGAYRIKENTLIRASPVPNFGPSCIRIKHREYIADVVSSSVAGNFSLSSFSLNPGVPGTFPWLSTIAQCYEEYKFNGLVFEFVSTSANALNSTNTALGKVILATDYNASNENFLSMQEMMATEFSNYGKPAESLLHAIECATDQRPMILSYIRQNAQPANTDIKMYDLGNFQVATFGLQGTSVNVGSLWVTYDITFCKPILPPEPGGGLGDHFQLVAPTTTNFFAGAAAADGSSLGCIPSPTGGKMAFPPNLNTGLYLIVYTVYGSSTANVIPGLVGTNCVAQQIQSNNTVTTASSTGQTGTVFILSMVWRLTGTNAFITFSGGTLPASSTFGDLFISEFPEVA